MYTHAFIYFVILKLRYVVPPTSVEVTQALNRLTLVAREALPVTLTINPGL